MRVLVLTHRLPYAPNRGDRIRAWHELRTLRHAPGIDVDLVSLVHDREERTHVDDLKDLVDRIAVAPVPRLRNWLAGGCRLHTGAPLTHALLDSPAVLPALRTLVGERRPDVVLAYCSGMARFALEPPLAGLPLVVDLVDVDSLKWGALAGKAAAPLSWIYRREAASLGAFEARAARAAFATVVVNDRERDALAAIAPNARIEVVPSGVDWDYWRPRDAPQESQDVVFCGVMNYAPNEEAALWLAREVWPAVVKRRPGGRLRLVGSHPTTRVRKLARVDPTVEVTGHVPDVRPYLWRAAVAAAPLHTARGIQNKVLEAVAAGLPTVVTPVVADGLPVEILPSCFVAEGVTAFAAAIVRGLDLSPPERRAEAGRADLGALGWDRRLAPLVDLLRAAASSGRR